MRLICYLTLLLFISSCDTKEDLDKILKHTKNDIHVNHEVISLENDLIKPGGLFFINDSLLLIKESYDKNHISLLDINNLTKKRYLSKGKGPEEFIMPGAFSKSFVSDIGFIEIPKSIYFNVSILDRNTSIIRSTELKLEEGKPYYTIQLGDSSFISIGCFKEGKYTTFNKEGKFIKSYLNYPDNYNIDNFQKGIIYQGKLIVSPDGTKVLYCARRCGLLDFLTVSNNEIKLKKRICYYTPKIKLNGNRAAVSRDNISGFHDAYVNDSLVYVAYAGKTYEKYGQEVNWSNTILKYDWNGNYLGKIVLDKEVFTFTLDPNQKAIYAITLAPKVELVKFNLDEA